MPDAALVADALRGDRTAYGALAMRYRSAMIRTATAVVGVTEAEDVVQETLLRGYVKLRDLRDPSAVGAWLLSAVRNAAVEVRRRGARGGALRLPLAAEGEGVEEGDVLERERRLARLRECVERLPEAYRAVVSLRHTDGMTCAQIARVLRKPLGTVTSTLSRAYGMLREGGIHEGGTDAV
ncbi:MAG: RNA polymerase sigma factor [Planctomycetes bacterium]|nr:RNA polymerase sigma factor [Planctomycetota bacterium]